MCAVARRAGPEQDASEQVERVEHHGRWMWVVDTHQEKLDQLASSGGDRGQRFDAGGLAVAQDRQRRCGCLLYTSDAADERLV